MGTVTIKPGPLDINIKQPGPVRSNRGPALAPNDVQWLRPTSKDTPMSEMRARLREDGYVFIKNLLPREEVLRVREEYFKLYEPTGILKPDTSPRDGIFNSQNDPLKHGGIGAGELPPTDLQVQAMIQAHTQPLYLQFLEHPELRRFVRDIMEWDREVLLQRTMIRHNAPGALSTGIHYDKLFLRKGVADFLTAWIPIGDIKSNGGGLIYLSDSVQLGRTIEADFKRRAQDLPEQERISAFNAHMNKFGQLSENAYDFHQTHSTQQGPGNGQGPNDANSMSEQKRRKWLVADYEAGDIVFHDAYIIHASCKNEDPSGQIRLSTDIRFYEEGSDLDDRWMKLWVPGDGL